MRLEKIGANVTVIYVQEVQVMFSYETPVAAFIPGEGYVKTEKKWSVTTSKQITQWAGRKVEKTKPQEYFDTMLEVYATI